MLPINHVSFRTPTIPIRPGSLTVVVASLEFGQLTLTANQAGVGKLIPNKLPQKNTVFTLTYNYGDGKTQTVSNINPDGNQKLTFTIGTGSAIQPSSVVLDIPVAHPSGATGTVSLHDVPVNSTTGNLVDQFGNVQGNIIYATGVCEVTPYLQKTTYTKAYTPSTYYVSG